MHAVSVAASGGAASGAGAHLLGVYTALANRGRMIPGGTCPTVGIAGLTQGGGIGLSGRKFGLTCDHLVEATVVLADGTALVVNAQHHPDLYWALRGGGGGNFGIVTRFVFRTNPAAGVSTYSMEWPWSDAKQVVQAWQAFAPHDVQVAHRHDRHGAGLAVEHAHFAEVVPGAKRASCLPPRRPRLAAQDHIEVICRRRGRDDQVAWRELGEVRFAYDPAQVALRDPGEQRQAGQDVRPLSVARLVPVALHE